MNNEKGKWTYAFDDMIFDIVCEFASQAVVTKEDSLALYDSGVFIPDGIYNQKTAKRACKNRGGVLYNPQSFAQRNNTLGRGYFEAT